MSSLMKDAMRFAALQAGYVAKQSQLWMAMLGAGAGVAASLIVAPGDKRFSAKEWRDNAYYSYLKQSYLLAAEFLNDLAGHAELDEKSKERLQFAVKQWTDA